jgi:glycosyltransferase involved in cell wall biosynthesis
MRIGMIAPPWYPVPPPKYGGTESVVALLTEGLVDAGIDVTLFATGDSSTSATLEYVHLEAPSARIGEMALELEHVLACVARHEEFDVVHDHSGLLAVALAASIETSFVHTCHGPLTGHSGVLYTSTLAFNPRAWLIALTDAQRRAAPKLPWLATCPNAIEVDRFRFRAEPDDYVAFLGRMSPEKGAREAVEVARAAGIELRIGAKCREPAERAYFDEFIRPHLDHGVQYLGELSHDERVDLLGGAVAVLCPINWEEPFGLVVAEAGACGAPVVATGRGSIPEIVVDGVTGIIVEGPHEMPAAIEQAVGLDRRRIRRLAEESFSPGVMIEAYLNAYQLAIEEPDASMVGRVAKDVSVSVGGLHRNPPKL